MECSGSDRRRVRQANAERIWHEDSCRAVGIGDATLTSKGEVSEKLTKVENVTC